MPKSLYCPNQTVLSNQGKENWDKIEWGKPHERDNLFVYELIKKGKPLKDKRFIIY